MATIANTSSADFHDVLRQTDRSAELLTNRNRRIIRTPSSPLFDHKGKIGGRTKEYCAQNYSPCSCDVNDNNQISVVCYRASVETVRNEFQHLNDPEIYSLIWLYPSDDGTNTIFLPADFLGNTSVTSYIKIEGYGSNKSNLVIDPFAFSSSQNSLTILFIDNCNFDLQKDFNFLNGFNRLDHLSISRIVNLTHSIDTLTDLFNTFVTNII